jgi:4-hydroxybenzoate polyprenyltransferase
VALAEGKAERQGFDIDTAFERHPLAAGTLRAGAAVAWVGGLSAVAAISAWILSPACLALFGVAVLLEFAYCSLRSRTWMKTFVSGLMVGIGALAGWVAVAPLDSRALIFVAFLGLWEIAGRNLPNDLSDLAADRAVGLATVATVFGPVRSAHGVLVGAFATVGLVPTLGLTATAAVLAFLLAVWTMIVPALVLAREPTPRQAAAYFNRASLLPALVFGVALSQWLMERVI